MRGQYEKIFQNLTFLNIKIITNIDLKSITSTNIFFFSNNQDNRGYEELSAPDFIQTVTPPSLGEKAFDEFKFARLQPRQDQDFPFSNHGKSLEFPSNLFGENLSILKNLT